MQYLPSWKNALLAAAFLALSLLAVAGWERPIARAVAAPPPVSTAIAPGAYVGDRQPLRLPAASPPAPPSPPSELTLRELSGFEGGFVAGRPSR